MENTDILNVTWGEVKDKVVSKKEYNEDTRFWKLVDDDKKSAGGAFIFVIDKDTKLPFVTTYEFSGKCIQNGRSNYLIAKSRESIGLTDPISQWWSQLWNDGLQETSRVFSRKQANIANVFVLSDKVVKENSNKLFLFKFGIQLRDLFISVMEKPDDDGENKLEQQYELFNMMSGSYVFLKRTFANSFYNYNSTTFGILSDDRKFSKEKLVEIVNSGHSLNEFLQESYYPSYYENLEKLVKFVNYQTPNKADKISKNEYGALFKNFVKMECLSNLSDQHQIDNIVKMFNQNRTMFVKPSDEFEDDDPPFEVNDKISKKVKGGFEDDDKPKVKDEFDLDVDIDF